MTTRSTEQNSYTKYTTKIKLLSADIWFLKQCKKQEVYPNFIRVKVSKSSAISNKIEKYAKKKWLDSEIKYLYTKRSLLELDSYALFKKLTYKLDETGYQNWSIFQRHMFSMVNAKFRKKMALLNKKLKQQKKLSNNKSIVPTVEPIDIVVNESTQQFNNDELKLLNNGLKFGISDQNNILEETITCVESAIQYLPNSSKGSIRESVRSNVSKEIAKSIKVKQSAHQQNTIKNLKKKDVFYLKADKGNKLVILDKHEYFDRMNNLIEKGPYLKLTKTPLPKMISELNTTLKVCKNIVTPELRRKLHVSNPSVPKLYGLPKIHKPGNSMRPIVSAIGAPTYKLAKWLTEVFENLSERQPTLSVKNSLEFIDTVKNITLQPGEILVSFDVSSLFPSVPIPQTLQYLKDLLNSNNMSPLEVEAYVHLTNLCMQQNCFQIENTFYEQKEGTAMGNPLSPFLANLFMSRFETEFKATHDYFPRIWTRYVDDIFAIFDTKSSELDTFIQSLNSKFPTIQFTMEKEDQLQLPFLDILISRKEAHLEFDIYRKDTSTFRYIPNHSHHCPQQKMASLNFLVHRLLSVPLNPARFEKEKLTIKKIAISNGYESDLIDKIIRKKLYKIKLNNTSTFKRESQKTKYISIPYDNLTRKLGKHFREIDFSVSFKSRTLQDSLGNPKDKVEKFEKSGIYEISCNECDYLYYGQSRRAIITRHKEHLAHIRFNRPEKSGVAKHCLEENHSIDKSSLKLIKQVNNYRHLDAVESLEIHKNRNRPLMNNDNGPIPFSPLYSLVG